MNRLNTVFFLLPAFILLVSCTRIEQVIVDPETADQTTYRSHTPYERVAEQIEESFRSVKRIQSTVFYRVYHFDPENPPTIADVQNSGAREIAENVTIENQTSAGTAVVISKSDGKIGLLTASHIVTRPDTVWHHLPDNTITNAGKLRAVSVLDRVNNYLFGAETVGEFNLVINDRNRDIALLSSEMKSRENSDLTPLPFRPGNTGELNWADLVYSVGYPKGVQMITDGIVSKTDPVRNRRFSINSPFNRGFSGGAVFAVRNDNLILEWVGMLTTSSAEMEYLLSPENILDDEYNPDLPYQGRIYVHRDLRINYGITHALTIDEITAFLRENEEAIRESGIEPTPL